MVLRSFLDKFGTQTSYFGLTDSIIRANLFSYHLVPTHYLFGLIRLNVTGITKQPGLVADSRGTRLIQLCSFAIAMYDS